MVARPVHSESLSRVEIQGEFKRDDVEQPFKIRSFTPPVEPGPPLPQPTPQPVVSNKEYVAEPQRRIYFATNRQHMAAKSEPDQKFPGKLNTGAEAITYGNCLVSIPIHHHTPGKIEQPPLNWWFLRDPEKYFLIEGTSTVRNGTEFFAATSRDDLLVYVHGYNNRFSDAILRSAQLQHDMKFPGKLVAFSWPSAGNTLLRGNLLDPKNSDALLAYNYDLDVAKKSVEHLATVLELLIASPSSSATPASKPPRRVHLIAHSMGNRVLALALQKMQERGKFPAGKKVFGNIVLAAADLESSTFKDILPIVTGSSERLSFYYSKDDLPLKLSLARSGNKPIGLNPVFCDGMDTICADGVNSLYLGGGHLYLGAAPDILVDLQLVLTQRKLPDQRLPPLLKKIKAPDLDECYYWVFK
ncbi:MAG: alpha/beta hydrolase [Pirellulaceae bacterium]